MAVSATLCLAWLGFAFAAGKVRWALCLMTADMRYPIARRDYVAPEERQ